MGIKELEGKILSDADASVKEIEGACAREVAEIEARFRQQAEENEERILAAGRRRAELARKEIAGGARLTAKVKALECKKKLLDEFFADAGRKILELPDADKKRIIAKLSADASLAGKGAVIYVPEAFRKLAPKNVRAKAGDFPEFGVVIESADGSRRIDNRLPEVLAHIREQVGHELNRLLWG